MRRFRVLHYKSGIDGKVVDNAIGFWTKVVNLWDWKTWFLPWYSHDEIWVPDETTGAFRDDFGACTEIFLGTCYSSTMGQIRTKEPKRRFEINGTRKLPASEVLTHPERWDYTEFEVEDYEFEWGCDWMDIQVEFNKGYAKRDISKFFPVIRHLVKQDKLRYICSEFGYNACAMFNIFKNIGHGIISPLRLARKMPWIRNLVTGKLVRGNDGDKS